MTNDRLIIDTISRLVRKDNPSKYQRKGDHLKIRTAVIGLLLSQLPSASFASALPGAVTNATQVTETQNLSEFVSNLDGYEVDNYEIELTPGSGTVGLRWGDRTRGTWGSSYATSTEIAYLYYQGKARAAGNVFDGKRIVQVCIWYTRNGVNLTATVCSNASSASGVWTSGPEVSVGAWDTLLWDAPKTLFNIQTVRISPSVIE